jgi:hypothetical protein
MTSAYDSGPFDYDDFIRRYGPRATFKFLDRELSFSKKDVEGLIGASMDHSKWESMKEMITSTFNNLEDQCLALVATDHDGAGVSDYVDSVLEISDENQGAKTDNEIQQSDKSMATPDHDIAGISDFVDGVLEIGGEKQGADTDNETQEVLDKIRYLSFGQTGGGKRARVGGESTFEVRESDPQLLKEVAASFGTVWGVGNWEQMCLSDAVSVDNLKEMASSISSGTNVELKALKIMLCIPTVRDLQVFFSKMH